ncbi:hypothetical protein LTR36_002228 [Oleoguttula mirabilis]|uniref:DM2 domain-containing protein n=1 Tax=Oleoguttula mirabilis TaxID=1507867 RepID=A0AAV9JMC3_9PEZI|nr:hypothetical protein LTR36_002228 [Oleoguttula mirabilis]
MATELSLEKRASYSAIIDSILASADLETISAKAIRRSLQEQVDDDLASEKPAITKLIMERFDRVQRERANSATAKPAEPAPTTNGNAHARKPDVKRGNVTETVEEDEEIDAQQPSPAPSNKRKAEDDDDDDDELSDVKDSPPPKKAKRAPKPEAESDEQMAKRLQAEFGGGGRSTRGGGSTKKKPVAKKEKKAKKKSAAKVNSDDDSGVEGSSSPKPEREKKGGFHKLMNLSEPLQALLGESQLSRPQTVKRIWAYVKERDLQDPSDKRQIRCDDLMRGVFKSDKIHMFTMNKVLAGQFYPVEE